MLELVVFDFDGTLMDTEARIVAAMQAAFRDDGLVPPTVAAVRDIIGLELVAACRALLPTLAAKPAARLANSYRHHYAALAAMPTPLFESAVDTLAALAAQPLMLAIATGKSRRGLDQALSDAGIARYFTATRTVDESPPKPHPGMLHDLLVELDVAPSRAVMVGDTVFDLEMAQAAGISAIAASYGAHPRERLLDWTPAAVIDALHELPGVLARLEHDPHRYSGVHRHGLG